MIAERLAEVRAQLDASCFAVGRDPVEVRLVAVSKTFPASAIREAYQAGQRDFGESYAQELRDKARELADLTALRWHYIGRLQANKAKYVAPVAHRVHALASVDDARALAARGAVTALLAVNTGGETQKGGVAPEVAATVARDVAAVPGVTLVGLMTLPPFHEDAEAQAPYYALLVGLLADCRRAGLDLSELSMGMSHDAHVAVRFGAGCLTWVRVGTAIFGARS